MTRTSGALKTGHQELEKIFIRLVVGTVFGIDDGVQSGLVVNVVAFSKK
jgi:hypothetical protein